MLRGLKKKIKKMKKLILLLLFIPLVSIGQKKSLLTKSGVSLTFDKPEGMKESSSGAAINPNVLIQYVNENNILGGVLIAELNDTATYLAGYFDKSFKVENLSYKILFRAISESKKRNLKYLTFTVKLIYQRN